MRPDNPRLVRVEALGQPVTPGPSTTAIPTALFDVDIHSGKMSPQSEQFADGRYGYDWNGTARILYVQPPHSLQRHFEHLSPGAWNKWGDLNALVGGHDFSLTVENYFEHRSYPFGFDRNRDILYFASNVGRDGTGCILYHTRNRKFRDGDKRRRALMTKQVKGEKTRNLE